MKHYLSTLLIVVGAAGTSHAGTFNSNGTGQFNSSSTWLLTGGTDADGIPDADDDITILNAHTVTVSSVSSANSVIRHLTIQPGGILTVSSPRVLNIWGNYQNNGSETGNGQIFFKAGIGTSISGSGTFSNTCRYSFDVSANRTILAGTTIDKSFVDLNISSCVVTNQGTYTVNTTTIIGSGRFVNATGGTLKIKIGTAFLGGKLDASASNNTVMLQYYATYVVDPLGSIYNHLVINGTGSLRLKANLQVNGDFTIAGGNKFEQNNFDLRVLGNFTKNGQYLTSNAGEIIMGGTTPQNITIAGSATTQIGNLRIDNPTSVTLVATGAFEILRSLRIAQGTLNMNNKLVTLISDNTATAVIGTCGPGAAITNGNNMHVQRFINSRAAGYSDMTCPYIGKTVGTAWDTNLLLVYDNNPPMAYPSIFEYNESSFDYIPVTSSSTIINLGQGYEVYLDSDGSQTTFNDTKLSFTGVPYIGPLDISGNITFDNDGWNLVGNPYHASINWDALFATTTDISPDLMFYDESIEDFITVTTGSGELIAPEQGFWVNVTGGSPNLVFTEATKSTSTSSTFRSTPEKLFTLRLKSEAGSPGSSGTSFRFANQPETALKGNLPFKSPPHRNAPTLCALSEGDKQLKISLINSTTEEINVPLKFTVTEDQSYTFTAENLESMQFEGYTCALLVDHKLGNVTNLVNKNYSFFAEKGKDENRFSLKLVKNSDCNNSKMIVSNDAVEINRLGENTLVQFHFTEETPVTITISDLLGQQLIPSQSVNATQQDLYLPLPGDFSGIYLVNVFYDNKVESKKLFK